jgi:LCP family protein required for cell wall assembly
VPVAARRPLPPRRDTRTPPPAGRAAGQSGSAGLGNRRWRLVTGRTVVGLVSLLVLTLTGYGWAAYQNLNASIHKSGALAGVAGSLNGDVNVLVMGLDSRLDENGNPLPADMYNALHAGDQSVGGMNANVLMLLHVPADGSKATAISIPRDDYASFPGCPDGQCAGKIKQAYGLAFDQQAKLLASKGIADSPARQQQQRDAGRQAETATVQQFLGGVPIDHFVEVTLVAFFQIAQVVQPITVCLLAATQDSYSGANFHAGKQQINGSQALAFVRQRRDDAPGDVYYNNFTDLDRERRQQAFIASLAFQLKQAGTFTDPAKLSAILNVASQNTAVDSGLNLLTLAQQAASLTSGNITFYTLPIDHFGTDSLGESVNFVDLPVIQSTVHSLLAGGSATPSGGPAPTTASTTSAPPVPPAVVDAVNASGQNGIAAQLEQAVASAGFTQGTASSLRSTRSSSVIEYGAGASSAAAALSKMLGGVTTQSYSAVAAGTLRVVIGTDFSLPASMGGGSTSTTSTPPPVTAVPGANGPVGSAGPPPGALSALSGGGIPCVK